MSAMSKEIMVVPRDILFAQGEFQGFQTTDGINYEEIILDRYLYLERSLAELDPTYKQPIGYALLVDPKRGLVFAYRRSSHDKDYPEKRLQGKWSWGLGGHIEKEDIGGKNPLRESMLREISEEVGGSNHTGSTVLGYINDESDPVGKVHFGILYAVETDLPAVSSLSLELEEGSFQTLAELDALCNNPDVTVEKWSRIALAPLRKYLKN